MAKAKAKRGPRYNPAWFDEEYFCGSARKGPARLEDTGQAFASAVGIEKLARYLRLDRRALVIGDGRGFITKHLAHLGWNATGVEVSAWAVNHSTLDECGCEACQITRYLQGDIRSLGEMGLGEFSVVVCLDVLAYLSAYAATRALGVLASTLKPSGLLMLAIGTKERLPDAEMRLGRLAIRPQDWWDSHIRRAGLVVHDRARVYAAIQHIAHHMLLTRKA